ncbi:MAG TPA: hypothetical protein VGN14_17930 [Candidatus Elarobacter sp.]
MIQPQWPGLGPYLYPGSLGGTSTGGWGANGVPAATEADGIGPSWWSGQQTNATAGISGAGSSSSGAIWNVLQQIMGLMGQLLGAVLGNLGSTGGLGGTGTGTGTGTTQPPGALGGSQQRFADVDISSTGDPHLAETGTRETGNGTTQSVDEHFDSMTSHDDLVSARGVAGGYRVSTTATQPGANGVTYNDSATVHANADGDSVTMQHDGSFSVVSNGQAVSLTKGQTVTLGGGESVTENQDGSLLVSASNGRGGSIATTLRSTGNGVDVSTHAHELAVGGDVVHHGTHKHHGQTPAP